MMFYVKRFYFLGIKNTFMQLKNRNGLPASIMVFVFISDFYIKHVDGLR